MKDFIKIKNLILVSNKGERNLINIPNLQFDSKSISVIIGPNGAGKSLLINLIQGLIIPSTGTIKVKSLTVIILPFKTIGYDQNNYRKK